MRPEVPSERGATDGVLGAREGALEPVREEEFLDPKEAGAERDSPDNPWVRVVTAGL